MDEESLLTFWYDSELGYLEEKINAITDNETELEIKFCEEFKNAVETINWDEFYLNKDKNKKPKESLTKKKFSFYVEDTSDDEILEQNYERKVKKNINYYINNLNHIEYSALNTEKHSEKEIEDINKILENTKTLKEKLQTLDHLIFIKK